MTGQIQGLGLVDARTEAMYKRSIQDSAETNARVNAANNDWTTVEALRRIVEHLSGMPGRRNLIWVKEYPIVPPAVMGILLQANIALYPVLTRSVLFDPSYGGNFMARDRKDFSYLLEHAPDFMDTQRAGRDLAAMTGGAGFDDAGNLQLALKTAEEDSLNAYTLGFYPAEDVLDGKYHRFTVMVTGEKSGKLEVRYRPGYVATRQEAARATPRQAVALAELFENPLDATAIGITSQVRPDTRLGLYQVRTTVDLHDVHLEREGNRSVGKVELVFPLGDNARVRTIAIDLAEDQLAEALKAGFVTVSDGIEASGDAIRVVVRDSFTGVAGSLRIPLRQ